VPIRVRRGYEKDMGERTYVDFGSALLGRNSMSVLGIQGCIDMRADSRHLGE
jgi:hypothetical protein